MVNNKIGLYDSDLMFLVTIILFSLSAVFGIGMAYGISMSSDDAITIESLIKPCIEQGYTKEHCMKVLLEEQSNWFEGHSR